jgi:hypothetical protein
LTHLTFAAAPICHRSPSFVTARHGMSRMMSRMTSKKTSVKQCLSRCHG